jgi:hypothetical protein
MLVGPTPAWAQRGSMITGTIRDSNGAPVPGATVALASPSVPGEAPSTLTSARGVYRLSDLPSAIYELTAAFQGLQTVKRTALRMPVGTTLTVDLTLPAIGVAGVPDTVTDRSAGPVVDVTSAASATTFSTEELENLPVTGTLLLQLAPGITPRSAFGGNLQAASQWTFDGLPVTITTRGGIFTTPVNLYWMKEVQIVGLGAGAEYGEFTGVVANNVLRSGSNRFSGLFEYRTTRSGMVSDNTGSLPDALRRQFRPQEILSRWNSSVQVGGPIRRDRLFFFAGFEQRRDKAIQAGTIGNVPFDQRQPIVLARLNSVAPVDSLPMRARSRRRS